MKLEVAEFFYKGWFRKSISSKSPKVFARLFAAAPNYHTHPDRFKAEFIDSITSGVSSFAVMKNIENGHTTFPKSICETHKELDRDRIIRQYNELLNAVETKHEGETRHQTALRYIREHESSSSGPSEQQHYPYGE